MKNVYSKLAGYATKTTKGRQIPEPAHPFRTPFQRDRDRIVHSRAFRRLDKKTQVFITVDRLTEDHFRTRLTHSIEVASIARTIARALNLNEDLTEAIALAHDIGHPPFGHAGEAILNKIMKKQGGFDHNRQALRIVEKLEKISHLYNGLNLTYEVREGIIKHTTIYDKAKIPVEYNPQNPPSLEAQIVNVADHIAYACHDLEDGIVSGILDRSYLKLPILKSFKTINNRLSDERLPYVLKAYLINKLVSSVIKQTKKNISKYNIKTLKDVKKHKQIVKFPKHIQKEINELSDYLLNNLYLTKKIKTQLKYAKTIITDVFNYFLKYPEQLTDSTYQKVKINPHKTKRIICDYIAGMTDKYITELHEKLKKTHNITKLVHLNHTTLNKINE